MKKETLPARDWNVRVFQHAEPPEPLIPRYVKIVGIPDERVLPHLVALYPPSDGYWYEIAAAD